MNARLSSLLVAGGVVLAGIHTGSLLASPATEIAVAKATLAAATLEPAGMGAKVSLRIPGMAGQPAIQVLSSPLRVVLDLPGVERGTAVTKKDLAQLTHPLVQKARLGQFSLAPKPVTRLVLEVAPGTQVIVGTGPDGVQLMLSPGEGRVQARIEGIYHPEALPLQAVQTAGPIMAAHTPVLAPAPTEPVTVQASAKPLASLPAVGSSFQLLPQLAVSTSLPVATPEAVQLPEAEKAQAQTQTPTHNRYAGRTLGETSTRYTGAKITIDLQNTDIRDFLRILAGTGKLNLVMDPDVQGNYGFKFNETPWDQVLDVVLKNASLGKEIQNGVLRVAKVDKLQKEEEERKKLEETKALAGELQTITRPLSYAKVSEVQRILKEMMTKRGSAILDDRTNTLIITDLPSRIPVISELLDTLDIQIQQVQIEARVVEANKDWQRQFGVKWPQVDGGAATIGGPWVGSQAPFWNGIQGFNRTASGQHSSVAWSPGMPGVTSIAAPAGELWLSFLSNRLSINAVLQALESDGTVKIVSSPKVVTQNNKKATILSGEKIPYPTQQGGAAGGAITVAFVDANLQLDVTPQITNEGTIIMDIKLEKAEADFSRTVNGTPTILRKALETQMLVRDGGTAVRGGGDVPTHARGRAGVPFLSKIPLLGFLFRRDTKAESNSELLIFITPRVLRQ